MSQQTELLGLTIQQLTEIVEQLGQPLYRARQLFDGLYSQRWSSLDLFTNLPVSFRQQLKQQGWSTGFPAVEKKFISADGTVRYLFGFPDGESVETVWMPEGDGGEAGDGSEMGQEEQRELMSANLSPRLYEKGVASGGKRSGTHKSAQHAAAGRHALPFQPATPVQSEGLAVSRSGRAFRRATICVSSQVGCAVDCSFCMTALLGLKRNLTPGEIVGQILAALNDHEVDLQRDRINLVFMGQGEPFLNYDNFMHAVRLLVEAVGIPESRMTVSTSGIVPRIADFGSEPVRPKLAISMNAPTQDLRTGIMPITKKWTIEKLIASLRDFPLRNRERLTFEYVLLGDVNDEPSHALELADLIRGLRAKVNLIALNPGPELPFTTPSDEKVTAFQNVLIRAGIPAFIRRPRGRDIYAACGQLKHTTELVQIGG